MSSLPVPRHAISAGEKLGQRQPLPGTSRQWRWKVVVMVILRKQKTASRAGAGELMVWGGAGLRAAAEELQLDGGARAQRQHDVGGDHAHGGLHRGPADQPDAVH
jgi:hypothetical protein